MEGGIPGFKRGQKEGEETYKKEMPAHGMPCKTEKIWEGPKGEEPIDPTNLPGNPSHWAPSWLRSPHR